MNLPYEDFSKMYTDRCFCSHCSIIKGKMGRDKNGLQGEGIVLENVGGSVAHLTNPKPQQKPYLFST